MNESNQIEDKQAWKLIESTLQEVTREQRRSRRWGIVFKTLGFLYLFSFIAVLLYQGNSMNSAADKSHVALINVRGLIAENEPANANAIASSLRKAFEQEQAEAVLLSINSPGGSPVQSSYIYNEIQRLRNAHPEKKVYAVISDLGASGAYFIAAAADEIYANPSSLIGSIGVTASGFGFVDLMEKIGVERRHFTAGEHKAFLDPFTPVKPEEADFWSEVLDKTHQQFISAVKKGRGDRLANDESLFTGLIWNGDQAKELGLIDNFGSAGEVARDIIGVEEFIDYTTRQDPLSRVIEKLGTSMGKGAVQWLMREQSSVPQPLH